MEEKSFLDRMLGHLRETCKYSTGYPKDLGPSRVIQFKSEREFIQLLHQGYPVVVAFTIRGNYTEHLDQVLEVECPKYPGFCITRQRREYPFIEIFHSPEQAANRGRVADPNITKYSAKALPQISYSILECRNTCRLDVNFKEKWFKMIATCLRKFLAC